MASLRPRRPPATSSGSVRGRSVARSASGSGGCPSTRGGSPGRSPILEQSDLLQAARLAGLEEDEAADAADAAGDRRDPRARPAADVHPSDRPQRALLGALGRGARAGPPPRRPAARRAAGRERARRRAPAGQRAGRRTAGSWSGWSRPRARRPGTARPSRRPSSCAGRSTSRRRRPTSRDCCSSSEWPRPAPASTAGPSTCSGRWTPRRTPRRPPRAARVLARALNRAQRFARGGRGSRSCVVGARLAGHAELALQLEAAAVVAGMNDPVTAPSVALRREALRERAAARSRRRRPSCSPSPRSSPC